MLLYKDFQIGEKIGSLTILSKNKDDRSIIHYNCKCDCGNIVYRSRNLFINCLYKNKFSPVCSRQCSQKRYLKQKISKNGIYLDYLRVAKNNAYKRNYKWELSVEYLDNLFLNQDKKCAISRLSISFDSNFKVRDKNVTASLDRIDSKKDYIEGNVQWVHKDINKMKQDYTQKEFIEMCCRIHSHQVSKNINRL